MKRLALLVPILAALAAAPAPQTMPSTPRPIAVVAIDNPRSLAIDAAGNLYAGNIGGGQVYKITPEGKATAITTEAGDVLGLCVGHDAVVYVADASGNNLLKIAPGKPAASLIKPAAADMLKTPTGVAVDSANNVFVANNADNTILKVTPDGAVAIFAGTSGNSGAADGTGPAASFAKPRAITIDGKDNLYVADEENCNIRMITPAGVVTTVAGKAGEAGSTDGAGAAARFGAPRSLAAAADGTLYIADTDNNLVRKIAFIGTARRPEVTTLAGKAGETGGVDGTGVTARFSEPRGIAVDAAGNVFLADSGNGAIRQITPAGVVTTITKASPTEK